LPTCRSTRRPTNVAILVFSEFGRRIHDNGGGTDHGAGGTAFVIGGRVRGGFYGEVPSLAPSDQEEGDLKFNVDFRKVYATILERWLGWTRSRSSVADGSS